ncbi:MAG: 5-amino-6-(5-phosphoribosylamino)uracil reductase [Verrucomicrobia bacterium]|jgi:riboflavin-specific deaminase-like protein|nr:5-amino-6-(5-phosphoribosylamino)uracil reductase [Verrucomicrobiota bacterium]
MIDVDGIWPALLECRAWLKEASPEAVALWEFRRTASGEWTFSAKNDPADWEVSAHHIHCRLHQPVPAEILDELGQTGLYLRLLQSMWQARAKGRVFVTAHCAQSLDGYMATRSGDSQWIGNRENLVHAHRLRALHDGILVGANTLRIDRPRLTVRHVTGENPLRTVLTSKEDPDSELRELLEAAPMTLLIHAKGNGSLPAPFSSKVQTLALETTGEGTSLEPCAILQHLFDKGLHSLMIEGGGATISRFLEAGQIDELQIHIAPIILGGGIAALQVAPCNEIGAARLFPSRLYPMNGQALYILQPETSPS